jgi:hypothetical protein
MRGQHTPFQLQVTAAIRTTISPSLSTSNVAAMILLSCSVLHCLSNVASSQLCLPCSVLDHQSNFAAMVSMHPWVLVQCESSISDHDFYHDILLTNIVVICCLHVEWRLSAHLYV